MQEHDISSRLQAELASTSNFDPQRFLKTMAQAKPEDLRGIVSASAPGTRFFVCKNIALLPDSDRKIEIALVLADELTDDLVSGVQGVVESLTEESQILFVELALEEGNLNSWRIAIDLTVREGLKETRDAMMHHWGGDEERRALLAEGLAGVGGAKGMRFLSRKLGSEQSELVIRAILTASFKTGNHVAGRHYARFSRHTNAEMRLLGIRGLAPTPSWFARRRLMQTLPHEQDLRVFSLIARILLHKPSHALAAILFEAATVHPDPAFCESATRLFRQVPGKFARELCLDHIENPNAQQAAFAIQEFAHLNDADVPEYLIEIAVDPSHSVFARSAAIEGLGQHKSQTGIDLLFQMVRDPTTPPMLMYSALTTLTRLCDESHLPEVRSMLTLDDRKHAVEIQAMLSFLDRKVRAKKVSIDQELNSQLSQIALNGSDTNSRYLALRVILNSKVDVPLQPFLDLVETEQSDDFMDLLASFLATKIQRHRQVFLHWLMHDSRRKEDVLFGLRAVEETQSAPNADLALFITLLSWEPGQTTGTFKDAVGSCLRHLLRNPTTAKLIEECLPSTDKVIQGFLAHISELSGQEAKAIAHDSLIDWLTANPNSPLVPRLVPIVAQFKTDQARTCLVMLFCRSKQRDVIAETTHSVILEP